MCRLAAYLGQAVAPRKVVFGGNHSLFRQSWEPRELLSGVVNADGYGVVWYHEGRPVRMAEPRPIWFDEHIQDTLSSVTSRCVVAALRNATPGLPVDRAGLLPLVFGRWCFVLNGYVPDFRRAHMRRLRQALPDDLYAELEGSSDAETIFLLVVAALREGADLAEALGGTVARVLDQVGAGGPETQLGMLLSDGECVAVLNTSNVEHTNSLYVARHPPLAPGGVLVASEPLDGHGVWEAVPAHHLLTLGEGVTMELLLR